ncbi:MAG: zinc-ribbon domain-containing protein [Muribaculaceae bacterium]|nr:zinc-ribbon domain-containing protein [Muribaculaceae bacterium]
MNCPKCNSELREGAKFCTQCGQKIETSSLCPQCNAPLKPGAKFCTRCGYKLTVATVEVNAQAETKASPVQVPDDMNTAKGRIYWNVQPGQVARVITESEFETYNKIQGIIVPEGTTAYIRANGRTIASISGGTYDLANTSSPSSFSVGKMLKKGWQMIVNLFSGTKKNNTGVKTEEEIYLHQQKVILENAEKGAAFSVIILLDKAFPLMIGAKQSNLDDYKNFVPMQIQTRHIKMGIGVNAYFKISDPERFILHYLTDKQKLNSALIVDEIADTIRVVLQDALYDTELESNRIPTDLHTLLKDRINAVAAETFFGLSVVRIVEISAKSEDLERFSQLSQELYLSEKELDYLLRTNDFKNRLADAVNAQEIHQAETELDLRKKLNAINRNQHNEELLNEDELLKFEHLLLNERKIREAKTENETQAALAEIYKTGLIRQDELETLAHQVKTNSHQRNVSLAMMQLRDGIEFERVRLEGETEKAVVIVKKELEIQGLRDDYADSRFNKKLEQQRAIEDTKLDLEQRKRDIAYNDVKRQHDLKREDDDAQFRQFLAMQAAEEQSRENQRKHEAEMEQNRLKNAEELERMKWENAQTLSDEKVWALNGGDGAVAYAQNKYNADRERETSERLEAQRRELDARIDAERAARDADQQDTKARMFEMMNNMMSMASGMQAQRSADNNQRTQEKLDEKDRLLREQDERIRRQESRMDTAYDRALDYTTRDNTAKQPKPQRSADNNNPRPEEQQPTEEKVISAKVCSECGEKVDTDAAFCENCGSSIK